MIISSYNLNSRKEDLVMNGFQLDARVRFKVILEIPIADIGTKGASQVIVGQQRHQ